MSLDMGRDTPALSPSGEACQAHRMLLGYSPPKDDKAAVLGTSHGVPAHCIPNVSEKIQYGFCLPTCELGAQQLTIAL